MIFAIAALASGLFSAYSGYQQANAQADAAKAEARNAELNARNLELEDAENRKRQREENKRSLSSMRTRMASSGSLTTVGAPLAVLGKIHANLELGIQDAARASAIRTQNQYTQANALRTQAANIKKAGTIGAISSTIGAIGSASSTYAANAKSGVNSDPFKLYKKTRI